MAGPEKTDYQKLTGQLLFFAYILAIACLYIVPISIVFEPPYLLPVTNTIFTAIIPLTVALIAARAFLANGSLSLFMMGCGMLSFGISAAFAGWLIRAHDGPNINVTIYNSGALLGSLFHIFGAILGTLGRSPKWEWGREKPIVASVYAGITFLVILFTMATLQGVVPTFFIQGSGPTALRQLVLGLSIFFYAVSALLFMHQYLRSKQDFLYWYTLCLAMLALGLFAFYIQHQVGGLIGWAGRTANYVGVIFAALAVRSALQSARSTGVALEHVISGYFTDAEANFRSLVESAADAIVSYDQANRIILWNSGAERMFGYTKAEAIGASFYERIIPGEYSTSMTGLIAVSDAPKLGFESSRTTEINAKRKSGELLPVEISAFSRLLPSGSIATCIMRDITERKQAQEALRKSEERYRTLFEMMTEGFILAEVVTDHDNGPMDYRFLEVNTAGERFFGHSHEEIIGHTYKEIGGANADPEWIEILCRVALTGESVSLERYAPVGGHWVQLEAYSPRAGQFAAIFNDITERKRAEEALKEAKENLELRVHERTIDLQNLTEQLERSRHELRKLASELVMSEERERKRIAGVLHDDIAQVLAAARMRLDLLLSDPKDKQTVKEAKTLLVQSIQETRALMNDLGNPVLFELGLKAACKAHAKQMMERHTVRISCDMRDEFKNMNPDVKIILFQVVRELLNNVVKHSRAENAHVMIDMEDGHFRVKVADDGVGFDPQMLGAPTIEGGFGLYSIRERLITLDGSLRIESAPATGTVVTAIVPATLV